MTRKWTEILIHHSATEGRSMRTWQAIRRDIGAFLTRLWRDGALMGATPEEAFFVKCDEETNPPENVDAGIVVAAILFTRDEWDNGPEHYSPLAEAVRSDGILV